jgi:mandelamide amidase
MARNVADIALVHTAITRGPELAPADLRGVRIGVPRSYFWETLDSGVAKVMEASLDKLRGTGAIFVDIDFTDLINTAVAVRAALRREGFRNDLAEFLAREYPAMTMKDAIPDIPSKRVRALEEDARDHPPSREDVAKAQASMDVLGPRYVDAFRQQNIVAIAHPTMPISAPLLPIDGDALPSPFEINGRQYPDTAILRNSLPGPAFRAPGLSIPAGLTPEGLPAGLEIDGLARPGRSIAKSRDGYRSRAWNAPTADIPQRLRPENQRRAACIDRRRFNWRRKHHVFFLYARKRRRTSCETVPGRSNLRAVGW